MQCIWRFVMGPPAEPPSTCVGWSADETGQCANPSSPRLLQAQEWRQSLGWTTPKLAVADYGGVRGVVATEAMKGDEVAVTQPFPTVINGNSMMWFTPFAAAVSQKFWSKTDS